MSNPKLPPTSPPPPPPRKPAFGGTFGVIAIAIGVGIAGAYILDLHSHVCDECGHRWNHLGAFNFNDAPAHTCAKCGAQQWWKSSASLAQRNTYNAQAYDAYGIPTKRYVSPAMPNVDSFRSLPPESPFVLAPSTALVPSKDRK